MGWKRPNILRLFMPWAPKTTPFGTFRTVEDALERGGDSEGSHQRRHGSFNATSQAKNFQMLILEAQLTRSVFLCPTPSSGFHPTPHPTPPLGAGLWALGSGLWALGCELWALGSGL